MLTTARNYSIRSKGVYFDLKLFCEVTKENRNQDTVYFPSKSEFNCFLLLYRMFRYPDFEIRIHPREVFSGFRWEIDFKIVALDNRSSKKLASLANAINGSSFNQLNELLIEYKGFLDKNFRSKAKRMKSLCPMRFKQLIVLSQEDSVYRDSDLSVRICSLGLLQSLFDVLV